jgi:hypothetical protein
VLLVPALGFLALGDRLVVAARFDLVAFHAQQL